MVTGMMEKLLGKKRKGQIGIVTCLFLTILICILLAFETQVDMYTHVSSMVEDSLASANLAVAVIDIEQYGIDHRILIKDPDASFELWKECFRTNLGLDASWQMADRNVISGPVELTDYIVYNVDGHDVHIHTYGRSHSVRTVTGGLGSVKSPDGKTIESTSIYSRVEFPVSGSFGITARGMKQQLVDVVRNASDMRPE